MQYDNLWVTDTLRTPRMLTTAGAGITDATGAVYKAGVFNQGDIIVTRILVDLTGTTSADSNLDVIGIEDTTEYCHLGQYNASQSGTLICGQITCVELPSSLTDIDFYSAALGTYVYEDLITGDAAEVALVTAGGAWAAGTTKGMTGLPVDGQYLYATNGADDTPDIFTAGIFLIELFGYEA